MKFKSRHRLTLVSAAICSILCGAAFAEKVVPTDALKKELRSVAVPELGAKAAQIVANAKSDVREATAVAVVASVMELRPVALVTCVSAIARQNPEVAPAVAARAASLSPKEAAAIARAAAGAAPTQAAKIVFAICKAVPTKFNVVATAVAQVVPYAGKEVVAAVTAALPALKRFIDRADTNAAGHSATVADIMAQTDSFLAQAAQLAGSTTEKFVTALVTPTPPSGPGGPGYAALPPPTVGPPYAPLGGPPTELNRTNTGEVPPGGIRYSSP